VRDQLARRVSRRPKVIVAYLMGSLMNRERHEAEGRGLASYAFAVDDAAVRLSPEERQVLRTTGRVPGWFLDEVERLRRSHHPGR
jgi:hypothetical protein